MEVHLCCSKQRLNLQYICLLFSTRNPKSAHTWGQVAGSEGTGLFVCMRRTHFAGTMGKLVHTKLSVHFNVVEENVCKRSAQYVTLKIEVIFSTASWQMNANELNFLRNVAGTTIWYLQEIFILQKKGKSHEENCRWNMCPLHVPTTCSLVWAELNAHKAHVAAVYNLLHLNTYQSIIDCLRYLVFFFFCFFFLFDRLEEMKIFLQVPLKPKGQCILLLLPW